MFHIGQHTCPAKSETGKKQKAAIIRDMFTKDPNLKPSEVQSALVVSFLRGEEDWDIEHLYIVHNQAAGAVALHC